MITATRELELKHQIKELVEQAYVECGQKVSLLKGKYLVRVLPKEAMSASGLIVIPDKDGPERTNKPTYEAVVLETYERYHVDEWIKNGYKQTETEPDWICKRYWVEPVVSVGDHILFQHWVGIPVPCLDLGKGEYRVIPEAEIVATVHYKKKKTREEFFDALIEVLDDRTLTDSDRVNLLLERFNVVSRSVSCKTMSGE